MKSGEPARHRPAPWAGLSRGGRVCVQKHFSIPSEQVCVRRRLILKLSKCKVDELKGKNEGIYVNSYQLVEFSFSFLSILVPSLLNCSGIKQTKALKSIVALYELNLAFFLLLLGAYLHARSLFNSGEEVASWQK